MWTVLAGCAGNTTVGPGARMEPALVLLARRLTPNLLDRALGYLLDAIQPAPAPGDDAHYYLHLSPLPGGDWDLRGVLEPEAGQVLADELARREQAARTAATDMAAAEDATADTTGGGEDTAGADNSDGADAAEESAADGRGDQPADGGTDAGQESAQVLDFAVPTRKPGTVAPCTHRPGGTHPDAPARRCSQCGPWRFTTAGRRRHDALVKTCCGTPPPAASAPATRYRQR